ncbi:hypothetical protein SLEP1_g6032 [Rubroshorea leprosula]|uniref:Uncharacterized protein n=1 Tax=Rubroshorea leprosula TaxID=152421 RepID=A0AAV5HU68_9ROSI|nr:hypothetical protein SLEP1_g6032 [Rubroshorea leprosula]
MASWLQARPGLNSHKDELKQLSSSKVVYLIQAHLGMGCDEDEDEQKQLSSSEVYLIQVDLGMGCHEDELKQLSSSKVVYLIQGGSHRTTITLFPLWESSLVNDVEVMWVGGSPS